jgi:putative tricarboxylic transport membrane protein
VIADRLLGLAFIGIACAAGFSAWNLVVPFAADPLGPSPFPITIALVMGLCGAILVVQPVHGFERPERLAAPPMLVLAMVLYALSLVPLGFMPATALMAAAVALLFSAKPAQAAVVGIATALVLWGLFDKLLDLPLPKGILPF